MEKAEATWANLRQLEYPEPLHPDVQKHILPIYEDLSKDDLLERYLGSHAQNANESFIQRCQTYGAKLWNRQVKIMIHYGTCL